MIITRIHIHDDIKVLLKKKNGTAFNVWIALKEWYKVDYINESDCSFDMLKELELENYDIETYIKKFSRIQVIKYENVLKLTFTNESEVKSFRELFKKVKLTEDPPIIKSRDI